MLYTVAAASAILAAQWVSPVRGADRPPADAIKHSTLSKCSSDIIIEILSFISEGRDYLSVSETCRLMNKYSPRITPTVRATVERKDIWNAIQLFSQQNRRVLMNVDGSIIPIRGYPQSLPNPFIGQCKVLRKFQCEVPKLRDLKPGCLPPMNGWVIGQCKFFEPSFLFNIHNGLRIALPACNGAGFISPSRIVVLPSEKRTVFELYSFDGEANIEKMTEFDISDEIPNFQQYVTWQPHRKSVMTDDDNDQKCPCMVIALNTEVNDNREFYQIDLTNKVVTKKLNPHPPHVFAYSSSSVSSISPDGSIVIFTTVNENDKMITITVIDAIKGEIKREWFTKVKGSDFSISPDNTWMTVSGKWLINLDQCETTEMMDSEYDFRNWWLSDHLFASVDRCEKPVRSVLSCHSVIYCGQPDSYPDYSSMDIGTMVDLMRLLYTCVPIAQGCWCYYDQLLVTEIAKLE